MKLIKATVGLHVLYFIRAIVAFFTVVRCLGRLLHIFSLVLNER